MTTEERLTLNLKFSSYALQSAVSIAIRTFKHIPKGRSILVNTLRERLRCSRKKPKLGTSPTARRETADVNLHMPCLARAAPLSCCAMALRNRFQSGMVGARHGCGMGTAWYV